MGAAGAVTAVSPRERRWSGRPVRAPVMSDGLSARAEVVRCRCPGGRGRSRSLRASGGGPAPSSRPSRNSGVSPRERRWSAVGALVGEGDRGLSARAEVVRPCSARRTCTARSLRASGGGPKRRLALQDSPAVSPRERRWSDPPQPGAGAEGGLSARAEVVRCCSWCRGLLRGSLRASGGGPTIDSAAAEETKVSPRERRWSVGAHLDLSARPGLSARAEVVRRCG